MSDERKPEPMATRSAGHVALEYLTACQPEIVGGSADLTKIKLVRTSMLTAWHLLPTGAMPKG